MKIVVKKVGKKPELIDVENELSAFQEIVGGYIECFHVTNNRTDKLFNVVCVCNEEGKLLGMPANFLFKGDVIVGDVFFCAEKDCDFDSLSYEQIERLVNIFK